VTLSVGAFLARRRITLSWIFAAAFVVLSRPTPLSVAFGLVPVAAGVLLRTWASGHIRKLKRLAVSGPYAHTRNPLYGGSFLIAVGALIMARSLPLAVLFALLAVPLYMTVMAREEGALQEAFGEDFRRYRTEVPLFFPRLTPWGDDDGRFDWELVMKHREWRLWIGVAGATLLLLAKALWM
jgi:protein-S-isoprenylcysteine O-methyltransferase Ste14